MTRSFCGISFEMNSTKMDRIEARPLKETRNEQIKPSRWIVQSLWFLIRNHITRYFLYHKSTKI